MAVAEPRLDVPGVTRPMTYEEYMTSPEEMARYDILNGWKVYRLYGDNQLANPTRLHQRIQGNLYLSLRDFAETSKQGEAILSPCDVQISFFPLHTRQPDILLISQARLSENPPSDDPAPLSPAPELVVEIVSPSDRPSVLSAKISDYRMVDVREIWVVRSAEQTVEVLSFPDTKSHAYRRGETVLSDIFNGLAIATDTIFQE
jgi:Uma2 family endonuclease